VASENVDLVRAIYAEWERGDFSSTEWAHSDIEYVMIDGPTPGSWRGVAGMTESWRGFLSAWEEFHSVVEEYRELDGERILVLVGATARGKTSGMELGQTLRARSANVFHIRDGKVTKLVVYLDRDRALADLELSPEDGTAV
jgi:ketosteroid isomerase-like protein